MPSPNQAQSPARDIESRSPTDNGDRRHDENHHNKQDIRSSISDAEYWAREGGEGTVGQGGRNQKSDRGSRDSSPQPQGGSSSPDRNDNNRSNYRPNSSDYGNEDNNNMNNNHNNNDSNNRGNRNYDNNYNNNNNNNSSSNNNQNNYSSSNNNNNHNISNNMNSNHNNQNGSHYGSNNNHNNNNYNHNRNSSHYNGNDTSQNNSPSRYNKYNNNTSILNELQQDLEQSSIDSVRSLVGSVLVDIHEQKREIERLNKKVDLLVRMLEQRKD